MPPEPSRRWFHGVELPETAMVDPHPTLMEKLNDLQGDFVPTPAFVEDQPECGPPATWSDSLVADIAVSGVDQAASDLGSAVSFVREVWPTHGKLLQALHAAAAQSALGKGLERHGSRATAFEDQPVLRIVGLLGPAGVNGPLYQAVKKVQEAAGFFARGADKARERAIAELLGAIVYLGAAVIALDEEGKNVG